MLSRATKAIKWSFAGGPLLWYLDPPSPHQLKRHKYKKKCCQSQNFVDPRLQEREREREREREHMLTVKLFHIILTSMLYKQLSACTCEIKL